MRRRLASLLSAALVATAAAFFVPASPASATGVCAFFLGNANTSAPMTYPVTVVPNSFGPSITATVQQPVHTTFNLSFTTGTCVNLPGVLKWLWVTGTVSGWCGHSSGNAVTNTGERFAWVSAGGLAVLTGGLTGIAHWEPDIINGETCNANKGLGADRFLVDLVALKTHCNITKTKVTQTFGAPSTLQTVLNFGVLTVNLHTGPVTYDVKVCLGGLL
jgi:hypothetical protein